MSIQKNIIMSGRFQDALALVEHAEKRLKEVSQAYEQCLETTMISRELKVGVREVIDNLRPALDYCAKEVSVRCGGAEGKVYFPIAAKGARQSDFRGLLGQNIPGLLQNRPDLISVFESFQAFADPSNVWLPNLATLSVENKHDQLTPQTRTETPQVRVKTPNGGMVSWNPQCVRISGPGSVYVGGARIDPNTSLPLPKPGHEVSYIIWVNITFDCIQAPVISFLQDCVSGVRRIVTELSNKL